MSGFIGCLADHLGPIAGKSRRAQPPAAQSRASDFARNPVQAACGFSWRAIPWFTTNDLVGGIMTWFKVIGLLCLVCWLVSWVVRGINAKVVGRGRWYDYLGLAAIVLTPVTVHAAGHGAGQAARCLPVPRYQLDDGGHVHRASRLYVIWAEMAVVRTIRQLGRRLDVWVLVGAHLALAAAWRSASTCSIIGYLSLCSR